VNIDERGLTNPKRFRLLNSTEDIIVDESQLTKQDLEKLISKEVKGKSVAFQTYSDDSFETYEYIVNFNPFRIEQKVNGVVTMIANKKDTLMFEDYTRLMAMTTTQKLVNNAWESIDSITNDDILSDCFFQVLERMSNGFIERHFG
jgi:hypothetical protein